MSRILSALLGLLLVAGMASNAQAQSEAGAQSLLIAPGARADGMGRAFVGVADDASAVWWNPGGMAFAKWLEVVRAQSGPGQIQINDPRHDLNGVVAPSQRWIYSATPATVQQYTFGTPVGMPADKQCGRVLFSDFHVTDATNSTNQVFPAECNDMPMTPQEKVLEFLMFDLASCQPETPPKPPEMPPQAPPGMPPSPPPAPPVPPPMIP